MKIGPGRLLFDHFPHKQPVADAQLNEVGHVLYSRKVYFTIPFLYPRIKHYFSSAYVKIMVQRT